MAQGPVSMADTDAPDPIPQQEAATGDSYWAVEDDPDEVPRDIRKFLIPAEKRVLYFRKHPAVLARQAAILLGTWAFLLGLDAYGYYEQRGGVSVLEAQIIRVLLVAATAWYAWHAVNYRHSWLVITPVRILTIKGIVGRKVDPLPMKRITDMQLEQGMWGRWLGFGTLRTESLHTEHALHEIHYVPSPAAVYSAIWDILLPQRAASPMPDGNF